MSWTLVYTKQAQRDGKKLTTAGLKEKTIRLLEVVAKDPFAPYEKLVGDLKGAYSRRINIQHRVVYQVLRSDKIVKVLRLWTHYE